MISARQFDHTVTVWGSQEVRGPTFGDVTRSWTTVPGMDGVRIAIQAKRETRQDAGPGERVVGEYMGYGPATLDVSEGDIAEITAGPDAPLTLKVDSVYRPRGRHTELVLIQWDGVLP